MRIGNGAFDQKQHDVWGAILDSVWVHKGSRDRVDDRLWTILARFVDAAIKNWTEPDRGIWEVRGEPKHFTSSKVMCWVAADRGAKLARVREQHERAKEWQTAADEMKADILANGVDERGVFTQYYGSVGPRRVDSAHPAGGVPAAGRCADPQHRARHRRRAHDGRAGAALPGQGDRRRALG